MEKKLNLYEKLIEIRKTVTYAQKTTKGFDFTYANESQILGAIRPKMDELGIFLETEIVSLENIECEIMGTKNNPGNKKIGGVRATFKFTWVNAENPTEKSEKTMVLQDIETDVQTVGGLMTYANRYFLYKSLSVPTDKNDPDAFDNSKRKAVTGSINRFLSSDQVLQIEASAPPKRIDGICSTYGVASLSEVESRHFDFIMSALQAKASK